MPVINPSDPEARVHNTEVFASGSTPPIVWTDLDLTSVIGTTDSIVLLRFYNNTGGAKVYHLRPNGETLDATNSYLPTVFTLPNGEGTTILIQTYSGIIEWMCSANTVGATISVWGNIVLT